MTTPGTTAADGVRDAIRAWLREHWDPQLSLAQWRTLLYDAGWAVPSHAVGRGGQGLPVTADAIVAEELRACGAPGNPIGAGMGLAVPTLLDHAADAVIERLLRPTVTGEVTWCQLFSEPGAGSDLAGLSTTARRDGDEWIVHGQKVWNTSAHHADYGLLLARTDWDAPKHKGLTYMVLPMKQPGVVVRPLRQMNFHSSFNEVFLDDARVPVALTVGDVGEGWRVATSTLMHERSFGSIRPVGFGAAERAASRAVREAQVESDEHFATYSWYPQRAGRADLTIPLARQAGVAGDPRIRQRLATVYTLQKVGQWTASRATANRRLGRPPGPEGSIGKLALSELARTCAATHAAIAGAHALLGGPDSWADGVVAEVLISVPGQSIAGGTDQIQKNILGERVLGLAKEPSVDTDRPFRDVPR